MRRLLAAIRAAVYALGEAAAHNTESSVYLGCQSNEYIDRMEVR